jgi:alkyl sulfatase BDS1-like metallo-beta-lactamase superfamily hydrolase
VQGDTGWVVFDPLVTVETAWQGVTSAIINQPD